MFRNLSFTVLLLATMALPALAQIQLKLTLSGVPSSVQIAKKNLKYGKYGAFCMVWDDRAPSAAAALPIMPSFTDGAGNSLRYTATVACNGVNRYGEDASGLTFPDLKNLVDQNWGIACHGYIHDVNIWADQGFTVLDNVIQNRSYFYDKLKEQGVEYVLRTGAVPNNDAGYQIAWRQIGSLCGTSEGSFDDIPATPYANWANNSIGDITGFTGDYRVFARAMKNVDAQEGTDHLISKFTSLIEQSTATANKILVFGTHETDNSFLKPAFDYLSNNSNDHIWVTSMHELMEYGETTSNTDVSYSLAGNVLTITLDQHLPDATRWRDISLGLTSDQQIVDVEFTGADRVTFNNTTGLINVFKKKTSGFSLLSSTTVLPVHFTSFSVNNGSLAWSVADKENLSHYEVERSGGAGGFLSIGKTSGETFRDPAPLADQYYRVKAVENNGKYVYSNTIRYTQTKNQQAVVTQQGNGLRLQFFSARRQNAPVQVFNSGGQLVYHFTVNASEGWNFKSIGPLPARGMYVIKVLDETVKVSR